MKIGITADVHLRGKEETPERYSALRDILNQLVQKDIHHLIIAGDLFDKEYRNYKDFDEICQNYKNISFYIIPGNHDENINKKDFASDNIQVFTDTAVFQFPESQSEKFLFAPYRDEKYMGEIIEQNKSELIPEHWVLIGHSDYLSGKIPENEYETGVYMPLTGADINVYKPARVILGHIHKPSDIDNKIYYPGSPFPLDITECGKRRYLILDLDNLEITSSFVNTEYIYFNETLLVIPVDDEIDYINESTEEIIARWGFEVKEKTKVKLRLKIRGATFNKNRLPEIIKKAFSGIQFYDEPDMSDVNVVHRSSERISILERVRQEIEKLEWQKETPTKEEILEEAVKTIFGVE